jgi:hypothetical protein
MLAQLFRQDKLHLSCIATGETLLSNAHLVRLRPALSASVAAHASHLLSRLETMNPPGFLLSLVALVNSVRLSLRKAANVAVAECGV